MANDKNDQLIQTRISAEARELMNLKRRTTGFSSEAAYVRMLIERDAGMLDLPSKKRGARE